MISYGGVYLEDPTPEQRAWVEKWISVADIFDFGRFKWPTKELTGLAFSASMRDRPVVPNTLWWPNGASRWSIGYFFATDQALAQIRPQILTSLGEPPNPLTLTLSDNQTFISASMYMLPPRPLAQVPTPIPGQTPPVGFPGLWLLTLVDIRYWWWYQDSYIDVSACLTLDTISVVSSGNNLYTVGDILTVAGGTSTVKAQLQVIRSSLGEGIEVAIVNVGCYTVLPTNPVSVTGGTGSGATFTATWSTGTATWLEFFNTMAGILGLSLTIDAIPSQYLSPPVDLMSRNDPLPILFDAAAYSVGARVVANLDGTFELQNATTAYNKVLAQIPGRKTAGGAILLDAANPNTDIYDLLPNEVSVDFPVTQHHFPGCVPYNKVWALAGLPAGNVPNLVPAQNLTLLGTKAIRSTAVPGYSTSGGAPLNQTELDALAEQIATDFYNWQLGFLDIQFTGVAPWLPEGLHDVEWSSIFGAMLCRVQRAPWNDWITDLQHSGTYGSEFYTQIAGIIRVTSGTIVGNYYDSTLQSFNGGTNTFTNIQPVWLKDPGASTIATGNKFIGVLCGYFKGRPIYALAGAATAGTSSLEVDGISLGFSAAFPFETQTTFPGITDLQLAYGEMQSGGANIAQNVWSGMILRFTSGDSTVGVVGGFSPVLVPMGTATLPIASTQFQNAQIAAPPTAEIVIPFDGMYLAFASLQFDSNSGNTNVLSAGICLSTNASPGTFTLLSANDVTSAAVSPFVNTPYNPTVSGFHGRAHVDVIWCGNVTITTGTTLQIRAGANTAGGTVTGGFFGVVKIG